MRHIALLLLTAAGAAALPSPADGPSPSQYDVEAVFLLNFTKFIEWPSEAFSSPDAPLTICVLGEDPFGQALDRVAEGETVQNRRLLVRRIGEAPRGRSCQVLFWSSRPEDLPPLLKSLGPGVLTVSEQDGFLEAGGMIRFVIENRRVHFDINDTAASAAKLRVSSQLLKVARTVR